jgi:hypothetical protein
MASKKGLVAPGYDGDPLLLAGRAFRPDGTAYRYGDLTPRFDRLASACVRTELIFDPQFDDLSSVRG